MMATFIDDLERFRRLVREMLDEIGKWRALVDRKRSPGLQSGDLAERLGLVPARKWMPHERYVKEAIDRHNELWTAWEDLSPNILPDVRAAQAPQLVEWVYCAWPDGDDSREPPRTQMFQSYCDAVGHATEHRHFLLAVLSNGMTLKDGGSWHDSSGDGCELECPALDAPAVVSAMGSWLDAPLWNRYDEMDLDWLRMLIEQEFLAARRKPRADDVDLSSADGPIPPRYFRCGGKQARLSKLSYRLVAALWNHEQHVARARKLVMDIWDDQEKESSALKSAINRANAQLLLGEVPVTISRDGDYVKLIIDRP